MKKLLALVFFLCMAGCAPQAPIASPQLDQNNTNSSKNSQANSQTTLDWPLTDAKSRINKKAFGLYVSPKNSPVKPEKFTGYHTGTDFETTEQEQQKDVPVFAICAGKLVLKKWAAGYGGVAAESCTINGQKVTVIYGHLNSASIASNVGDEITKGQQLGVLGKGFSKETDGERKHLHLGIHKGEEINILGYVKNQTELLNWIDPETVLP